MVRARKSSRQEPRVSAFPGRSLGTSQNTFASFAPFCSISSRLFLLDHPNLDVAEFHRVAVVLQADVAGGRLAKVGLLREFALGDALVPVLRAFHVFIVELAIHPRRAFLGRDEKL